MPKYIRLKTSVPGPRSQELYERRIAHVPRGVFHATPIFIERAEGAIIQDVDGNLLLDFAGGIGTMNVGHCNPNVVQAASEQLERFTHTCFSVILYENYILLAEKLNRITPGKFPKKTMLVNSGAEAVENAVKIARHYTGRPAVVVFEHAFHGRTLLTMSMTSKVNPYKLGFGPFAPEVYRLPYPDSYRLDTGRLLEDLDDFFSSHVAAENIACIVLELVTGEGGFIVCPENYLKRLSQVCKKHEILLIVDEVQTGFGRTGKMFACEHYSLEPDLIVLAKSLGGGLPLSAVTGRSEVMDSAQAGGLGGTYSGNPVSCAAALAAIEYLEKENLPAIADTIGRVVRETFLRFFEKHSFIGDVRGLGAMMGLDLVKDRHTKEPDKDRTQQILRKCYENGLILLSSGTHGNVIRTLMPLTISNEQLSEGLDVLQNALA